VADERGDRNDSTGTIVLGLLLPGGGHLYRGRFAKAGFFGALILGTFLAGQLLSGFHAVDLKHQPYWFLGQVFAGLPALVSALLAPDWKTARIGSLLDVGTLYTTVAGLLNILVILDAVNPSPERAGDGAEEGKGETPAR
jgi:hypothetical protein